MIGVKSTRRRRRQYVYKIGVRKKVWDGVSLVPNSYLWSAAKVRELLRLAGFKCTIRGADLVGFSRTVVDLGYGPETLSSIAGHAYDQTATLEVYAHPEHAELVETIIRGCYCDILEDV